MFNDDNTTRGTQSQCQGAALRGPSFILTDSLKLPSPLTTAINTSTTAPLCHPTRKLGCK